MKKVRVGVRAKILGITTVFVCGFLALGVFSYRTLALVGVGGPLDQEIVQAKDLVADLVAPRAYVLEAFLVAHRQLVATKPAARWDLLAQSQRLRTEFEERRTVWTEALPAGAIRDAMVEANRTAQAFFDARDQKYAPLLAREDADGARMLLVEELTPLFEAHRRAVSRVVDLASAQRSAVEGHARTLVWQHAGVLVGLAGTLLFVGVVFSVFVARRIVRPLRETARTMEAVAAGDLTGKVTVRTHDEIGRMATALNVVVDGMQKAFGRARVSFEDVADERHELHRIRQMVDGSTLGMMYVDASCTLRFMNPASRRALDRLAPHLPRGAGEIGAAMDLFLDHGTWIRMIVQRDAGRRQQVEVGPESIVLDATSIRDEAGQLEGTLVTWEVVTERVRAARREEETASGLRAVLSQVARGAEHLVTASGALTVAGRDIAARAEETSHDTVSVAQACDRVSETSRSVASSVEEIGAGIRDISTSVTQASQVAGTALEMARSTSVVVTKLGTSTEEIGKVVKTITAIAEHTNLLALNATIEAARAGAAGRGFAVVAHEVKELARETARATADISHRINAIQQESFGAANALGDVLEIIGRMHDLSNAIAGAVDEQTQATSQIGQRADEVARESAQISTGLTHVSEAVLETARNTHETRAAAEELARMASELHGLVDQKLRAAA